MNALLFVCFDFACWCWSYFKGQPVCRPLLFLNPRIPSVAGGAGARACSMQENNAGDERGTSATKGGTGEEGGGTSRMRDTQQNRGDSVLFAIQSHRRNAIHVWCRRGGRWRSRGLRGEGSRSSCALRFAVGATTLLVPPHRVAVASMGLKLRLLVHLFCRADSAARLLVAVFCPVRGAV